MQLLRLQNATFRFRVGLIGLLFGGVFTGGAFAQSTDRPNIVVFLVDDMGLMDSSVPFLANDRGEAERHPLNDFYRTPNIERLARTGTRFSNFYSMSVCSPSRIALMTGQTSARHHTTNWIDPGANNPGKFGPPQWQWRGMTEGHASLPRLLRSAGYRTIHCGKGHFGPLDSYAADPSHIGFDINIAGSAMGQPGSYFGTDNFGKDAQVKSTPGVPGLELYHGQEIFLTEALTLEMNKAIEGAVRDRKPFFAYMAHYAAHAPFQADPRFLEHYPNETQALSAFATLIEGMDKSLGDLLDQLDRLGVAENTLVFFVGDNGTDSPRGDDFAISCAAPLRGKKGTQYEGGMRVPFIAAWAKPSCERDLQRRFPIAQATISNGMGAIYDLFPTILAVAGVKSDQVVDGMDLWKQLAGERGPASDREFLMHYPHEHRSSYFTVYRRGTWKLVYHYRKPVSERFELFDLTSDRDESHNLASSNRNKLREMFDAMQQALEKTNAQFPLSDNGKTPLKPTLE